jgi:hypothetical protein
VLFRSKSTDSGKSASAHDDRAASSARAEREGKGRPTPKRKTSEALNKRPLVPSDRKAAGKSARVAARTQRDREYTAMQTGDERFLPAKDKGPVRRYVRDYVDARWNLGEFFLPIAMVFVLMTFLFSKNQAVSVVVIMTLYVVVLVTITDAYLMWRKLKKTLFVKFGEQAFLKGLAMYAVMRAFQIRRARLPKPQVKHGEFPV